MFLPTFISDLNMDVSAHECPRIMAQELQDIFPGIDLLPRATAIITMQHANDELVNFGEESDKEKDRLLENV